MCRADEVGVGEGRALEREANVFAAELLMPEELVKSAWRESMPATADLLGVSHEAMAWRLYNLGLVEERPVREKEGSRQP